MSSLDPFEQALRLYGRDALRALDEASAKADLVNSILEQQEARERHERQLQVSMLEEQLTRNLVAAQGALPTFGAEFDKTRSLAASRMLDAGVITQFELDRAEGALRLLTASEAITDFERAIFSKTEAASNNSLLAGVSSLRENALTLAYLKEDESWLLPKVTQLPDLGLAASAAAAGLIDHAASSDLIRSMTEQMAAVQAPWAIANDPFVSAIAFGRVSLRASDLLSRTPFTDAWDEAGRALFGSPLDESAIARTSKEPPQRDEARARAGAEISLLVIPERARLSVGKAVGLVLPPPEAPEILPLSGEDDYSFSPEAEQWLRVAELKLRLFVVGALRRKWGDAWENALPPGMLAQWVEKRAKQVRSGRPEYEIMHYADLGDWRVIINRNWKDLFSNTFKEKSYLEFVFGQLCPLRNEDGHHRPMGQTDQLVAICFSRMLLEKIEAYPSAPYD